MVAENHDRDGRLFNWLLRPDLKTLLPTNLAALEVRNYNQKVMARVFPDSHSDGDMIFAVAYRGHLRWGEPAEYCTPREW